MTFRTIIKRVLDGAGYQIMANEQPIYANGPDTEKCIRTVSGHTMLSRGRLVSLADQISYCVTNGVEGDLVECGVWKGGGVGMMAGTLLSEQVSDRHLHLFDSFKDICAPDPKVDGARALAEVAGSASGTEPRPVEGAYDKLGGHGTIAECRELIEHRIGYPASHVHYHKGWFQDTLPEVSARIGRIALLRLDGDWYASTKICLDCLFDKVVPGGLVVVDDYGTYEGCRKAVHDFFAERGVKAFLSRVDNGCYFFVKR